MEERKKISQGLGGFLKSRGRLWLLLGGILAGIFLIIMGSTLQEKENAATGSVHTEDMESLQAYEQRLEKEVSALCADVAGVGQVRVMVQLSGGTRVLYATDEKGKPASVGSGSAEQALPSTVLLPEIAGVAIVCRGGDSPAVQQKLIELVSTALGIPSNRVAVTGK